MTTSPAGVVDAGDATAEAVEFLAGFFAAKNAHDPEATHRHFHLDRCAFADATLGMYLSGNAAVRGLWTQLLPPLPPAARSYPTRILGGPSSALVFVTNTPEMFGSEIRSVAVVDVEDGRVVRWVDYWDGRMMGVPQVEALRAPADAFPDSFGEELVHRASGEPIADVARSLATALSTGDATAAGALFAPDAVLEDTTLHLAFHGRIAVTRFLERAVSGLPWAAGTRLRHVAGTGGGGGYEWTGDGPVRGGVVGLELDGEGRITRCTSVWDGTRLSDDAVRALVGLAAP